MIKCDVCGKYFTGRACHMGNTKANKADVCPECHKLWIKIWKKNLSIINEIDEYSKAWKREYAKFIGKGKEVVSFT